MWGLTLPLINCSSIQIPVDIQDETLYFVKGNPVDPSTYSDYAVQMHFLTMGQTDVGFTDFNNLLVPTNGDAPRVCMSPSAFDDFNTEVGKLCSQVTCDYQTVKALQDLIAVLHSFQIR